VRYRTFWQFPHQIALFGNSRTKSHFLVISASNRTFEQFPRQFALFTTYGTFSHLFIFLKKTIFCTFSHNNVRGIDANRHKTASVRLRAAEGHNFASAEFFQNPQNPFKIPTSSQSRVTDVSRDSFKIPKILSKSPRALSLALLTYHVIRCANQGRAAWSRALEHVTRPHASRDVILSKSPKSFQNPHESA